MQWFNGEKVLTEIRAKRDTILHANLSYTGSNEASGYVGVWAEVL